MLPSARGITLVRVSIVDPSLPGTRAEIDPERIGITGNSGGGTQTSMAMLADPRFAAAAPATFIMDRRALGLTR